MARRLIARLIPNAAGGFLTAKQAPRRPPLTLPFPIWGEGNVDALSPVRRGFGVRGSGTAPALGLRAGTSRSTGPQTYPEGSVSMFKAPPRPRCRPQLEFLEDRLTPSGDMVLQWNELARGAISTAGTPAPAASRILAITHAAMYDAVNTLDRTHGVYLVDALAHPKASSEAAVAAAAHRALLNFYPGLAVALDAQLVASLATIPDGKAEDDGVALGRSVADQILALRQSDGSGLT